MDEEGLVRCRKGWRRTVRLRAEIDDQDGERLAGELKMDELDGAGGVVEEGGLHDRRGGKDESKGLGSSTKLEGRWGFCARWSG